MDPLKNISPNAPWDIEFLMGSYLVAKELDMLTERISVSLHSDCRVTTEDSHFL